MTMRVSLLFTVCDHVGLVGRDRELGVVVNVLAGVRFLLLSIRLGAWPMAMLSVNSSMQI